MTLDPVAQSWSIAACGALAAEERPLASLLARRAFVPSESACLRPRLVVDHRHTFFLPLRLEDIMVLVAE